MSKVIEADASALKNVLDLAINYVQTVDPEIAREDSQKLLKEICIFNLATIYMADQVVGEKLLNMMGTASESEIQDYINGVIKERNG